MPQYAVRDDNFFMVRSIKGFKPLKYGPTDSRKILQFKIEWDIDGSETWEPWGKVRTLGVIRKWVMSPACTNKAVKALFPVKAITEEYESDEENEAEENSERPHWPNVEQSPVKKIES